MKQGITFEQLMGRVDEVAGAREDFYVPSSQMRFITDPAATNAGGTAFNGRFTRAASFAGAYPKTVARDEQL